MSVANILDSTRNRQYPIPQSPWKHYQEWHGNVMLHWKADAEALRALIPAGLELDLYNGDAYVSIIAFSVRKLHLRGLPPLPLLSDFHEVNLRTYVIRDGKPGIYFLSIEAQKALPAAFARMLMSLPYKKSTISRVGHYYKANNSKTALDIRYVPKESVGQKSDLDHWLTERHCLYDVDNGKLFSLDIHHKPWKLRRMIYVANDIQYPFCAGEPHLVHYAHRARVLLWSKQYLK